MKQIRLIAEDFDRLDIPCLIGGGGTGQYISNGDCPIARALKRKGHINPNVGSRDVDFIDGTRIDIEGDPTEVEAVRKSLLAGAKYGIIKVLK